jgi:AmmeMemoRadiSam system protein B
MKRPGQEPSENLRPPAVAGAFYPADPGKLAEWVDGFLCAAKVPSVPAPKALLAPHAGYVYSGPVAGSAYALLRGRGAGIRRVVLLGPGHRLAPAGLAAPTSSGFATPLGTVPLDRAGIEEAARLPQVSVEDRPHALEHSLEVHLPFLQRVLGEFGLVPLVVGNASPPEVAEVLDALWGGAETLVVVSSDLSHYQPYRVAQRIDRATAGAIERLDPDPLGPGSACGYAPVGGLLLAARAHGLRAVTLDLRNSGDTRGARDEVVGYGAWAFLAP